MRFLPGDFEVLTSSSGDTATLSLRGELDMATVTPSSRRSRPSGRELVLVRGPRAVHRRFEVVELESVPRIVDAPPG